jgi:hypothetical protein
MKNFLYAFSFRVVNLRKSHLAGLVAVFLLMITLGSVAIIDPSIFKLQGDTLVSVSQLYVDPQGSIDNNGNLVQSYWNLFFNIEGQNVV